jgi:hypothetical protein
MRGIPNLLTGVEDDRYYTLHRELFRKTLKDRERLVLILKGMQRDLADLEPRIYSKDLQKFQRRLNAFEKGDMGLDQALRWLSQEARPFGIDLSALQTDPVKNPRFFEDIQSLALILKIQKSKTQQEKDLVQVQHDLGLLLRVADLQATEAEVRSFGPRANQFIAMAEALLKDVPGSSLGVPRNTEKRETRNEKLRTLVSSSIDYYALAMMRNQPMVENTLALIGERPKAAGSQNDGLPERRVAREAAKGSLHEKYLSPPLGSPDAPATRLTGHPPVAVLIAGGFHTAPITQMLRERKVSYIVITPAVDKISEADHQLYVKRLSGQLLTSQDILSGNPSSLAVGIYGRMLADHFLTAVELKRGKEPSDRRLEKLFEAYKKHPEAFAISKRWFEKTEGLLQRASISSEPELVGPLVIGMRVGEGLFRLIRSLAWMISMDWIRASSPDDPQAVPSASSKETGEVQNADEFTAAGAEFGFVKRGMWTDSDMWYSPIFDLIYINLEQFLNSRLKKGEDARFKTSHVRALRSGLKHEVSHWRYAHLSREAQIQIVEAFKRSIPENKLEEIYRTLSKGWAGQLHRNEHLDYFLIKDLAAFEADFSLGSLIKVGGTALSERGHQSIQTLSLSTGEILNLHKLIDEILAIHNGGVDGVDSAPVIAQLFDSGFDLSKLLSSFDWELLERLGLFVNESQIDEMMGAMSRNSEFQPMVRQLQQMDREAQSASSQSTNSEYSRSRSRSDTNVGEEDIDEIRETHPKLTEAIEAGDAVGIARFMHADLDALFQGTDEAVALRLTEGLELRDRRNAAANLQAHLANGPGRDALKASLQGAQLAMSISSDPSQFDSFRLVVVLSNDPFFAQARLLAHTGAGQKSVMEKGYRVPPSIYLHLVTLNVGKSQPENLRALFEHEAQDFFHGSHAWRGKDAQEADRSRKAVEMLWNQVRYAGNPLQRVQGMAREEFSKGIRHLFPEMSLTDRAALIERMVNSVHVSGPGTVIKRNFLYGLRNNALFLSVLFNGGSVILAGLHSQMTIGDIPFGSLTVWAIGIGAVIAFFNGIFAIPFEMGSSHRFSDRINISTRFLNDSDQVRNTLLHEMFHFLTQRVQLLRSDRAASAAIVLRSMEAIQKKAPGVRPLSDEWFAALFVDGSSSSETEESKRQISTGYTAVFDAVQHPEDTQRFQRIAAADKATWREWTNPGENYSLQARLGGMALAVYEIYGEEKAWTFLRLLSEGQSASDAFQAIEQTVNSDLPNPVGTATPYRGGPAWVGRVVSLGVHAAIALLVVLPVWGSRGPPPKRVEKPKPVLPGQQVRWVQLPPAVPSVAVVKRHRAKAKPSLTPLAQIEEVPYTYHTKRIYPYQPSTPEIPDVGEPSAGEENEDSLESSLQADIPEAPVARLRAWHSQIWDTGMTLDEALQRIRESVNRTENSKDGFEVIAKVNLNGQMYNLRLACNTDLSLSIEQDDRVVNGWVSRVAGPENLPQAYDTAVRDLQARMSASPHGHLFSWLLIGAVASAALYALLPHLSINAGEVVQAGPAGVIAWLMLLPATLRVRTVRTEHQKVSSGVSRRHFLKTAASATAGVALVGPSSLQAKTHVRRAAIDWEQFEEYRFPSNEFRNKVKGLILEFAKQEADLEYGDYVDVIFESSQAAGEIDQTIWRLITRTTFDGRTPQNVFRFNLAYWLDRHKEAWRGDNMEISLLHEFHHRWINTIGAGLIGEVQKQLGPKDSRVNKLIEEALKYQIEVDCTNAALHRMKERYAELGLEWTASVSSKTYKELEKTVEIAREKFKSKVEAMPEPFRTSFRKLFPDPKLGDPIRLHRGLIKQDPVDPTASVTPTAPAATASGNVLQGGVGSWMAVLSALVRRTPVPSQPLHERFLDPTEDDLRQLPMVDLGNGDYLPVMEADARDYTRPDEHLGGNQSIGHMHRNHQQRVKIFQLAGSRVKGRYIWKLHQMLKHIRETMGYRGYQGITIVREELIRLPDGELAFRLPFIKGKTLGYVLERMLAGTPAERSEARALIRRADAFLNHMDDLTGGLADRRTPDGNVAPRGEPDYDYANFIVPMEYIGQDGKINPKFYRGTHLVNIDPINLSGLIRLMDQPDEEMVGTTPGALWMEAVSQHALDRAADLDAGIARKVRGFISALVGHSMRVSSTEQEARIDRLVAGSLTLSEALAMLHLSPGSKSEPQRLSRKGQSASFLFVASQGNALWEELLARQEHPAPLGLIISTADQGKIVLIPSRSWNKLSLRQRDFVIEHEILEVNTGSHAEAVRQQGGPNRFNRVVQNIQNALRRKPLTPKMLQKAFEELDRRDPDDRASRRLSGVFESYVWLGVWSSFGLTRAQIGRTRGVTDNQVNAWYGRAMAKLQELLKDQDPDWGFGYPGDLAIPPSIGYLELLRKEDLLGFLALKQDAPYWERLGKTMAQKQQTVTLSQLEQAIRHELKTRSVTVTPVEPTPDVVPPAVPETDAKDRAALFEKLMTDDVAFMEWFQQLPPDALDAVSPAAQQDLYPRIRRFMETQKIPSTIQGVLLDAVLFDFATDYDDPQAAQEGLQQRLIDRGIDKTQAAALVKQFVPFAEQYKALEDMLVSLAVRLEDGKPLPPNVKTRLQKRFDLTPSEIEHILAELQRSPEEGPLLTLGELLTHVRWGQAVAVEVGIAWNKVRSFFMGEAFDQEVEEDFAELNAEMIRNGLPFKVEPLQTPGIQTFTRLGEADIDTKIARLNRYAPFESKLRILFHELMHITHPELKTEAQVIYMTDQYVKAYKAYRKIRMQSLPKTITQAAAATSAARRNKWAEVVPFLPQLMRDLGIKPKEAASIQSLADPFRRALQTAA